LGLVLVTSEAREEGDVKVARQLASRHFR